MGKIFQIRPVKLSELQMEQRSQFVCLVEKFIEETYPQNHLVAEAGEKHSSRAMSAKERKQSILNADLIFVLFEGKNIAAFISGFVKNRVKPRELFLTALYANPAYSQREISRHVVKLPELIVKEAHACGFEKVYGIDLLYPTRTMWKKRLVKMPIVKAGGIKRDKRTEEARGWLILKKTPKSQRKP